VFTIAGAIALAASAFSATAADARPVGTVTAAKPLPHRLWIPGTTSRAYKLTYVTTNARGKRALSTGTLFLPKGRAPRGGWPVISWAHGTSGLADKCAPSRIGPALPNRDRPYLANWMREGYAVVASDYAGLGTPGLMAYLNGRSEAHNVVDMVKAGRAYARRRSSRLARKWVVIGQSQGAGAAIYTARYATKFGGRGLDYRGAVGTGTPAYVENVVKALGPGFPDLSPALTEYMAYVLAGLRWTHPDLGIDGALTDTGRTYLRLGERLCGGEFEERLEGVQVEGFFSRRLDTLPRFAKTVDAYMAMPESGFDKPFFMGQGLKDVDVPYGLTKPYVDELKANGEPLTFKLYDKDHSGTLLASQKDTHPFVRKLFAGR
jgi:Secretory lipase